MADVTIDDVRKATGKAYQILTGVMERYWNKKSQLYHVRLSNELETRKTEAYRENNLFPHLFFDDMADAVLRWHDKQFCGIQDIEIKPMFQAIWKYHRKYLGVTLTDDVVAELTRDGDLIITNHDEQAKLYVTTMIFAVMHDLEARNPQEEKSA